jgi:hypothetical protein
MDSPVRPPALPGSRVVLALALAAVLGSGCARLVTERADPEQPPAGVRIYPPKVYFFVDQAKGQSQVLVLPDLEGAYDIRPTAFLAEHDFKVELADGRLETLTSNADTTAILTFLGGAAETAAGAVAGRGVGVETLNGTFGLETGVYVIEDGAFARVAAR